MAGSDVTQRPTEPPVGAVSDLDPSFALSSITTLLQWIERARHLTQEVAFLAERDAVVRAALQKWNVAFNAAGWETHESDALQWLIGEQKQLIGGLLDGTRHA